MKSKKLGNRSGSTSQMATSMQSETSFLRGYRPTKTLIAGCRGPKNVTLAKAACQMRQKLWQLCKRLRRYVMIGTIGWQQNRNPDGRMNAWATPYL